jgi:hypothetical protein
MAYVGDVVVGSQQPFTVKRPNDVISILGWGPSLNEFILREHAAEEQVAGYHWSGDNVSRVKDIVVRPPRPEDDELSSHFSEYSGLAQLTVLDEALAASDIRVSISGTKLRSERFGAGRIYADQVAVNGVYLGDCDFEAGDISGTLAAEINSHAELTGVRAVSTEGQVVLESADGRNIFVENGDSFGFGSAAFAAAQVHLLSSNQFTVESRRGWHSTAAVNHSALPPVETLRVGFDEALGQYDVNITSPRLSCLTSPGGLLIGLYAGQVADETFAQTPEFRNGRFVGSSDGCGD